jgi:hypothetical protein
LARHQISERVGPGFGSRLGLRGSPFFDPRTCSAVAYRSERHGFATADAGRPIVAMVPLRSGTFLADPKGHLMSLTDDVAQNGGASLRFELGAAKLGAFDGFRQIYGFCDRMMP